MVMLKKLIRLASNAPANYKQTTKNIQAYSISSFADVKIVIENEKEVYTSGDVISGEVILDLSQEIDVSEVVIKYKVEESTLITTTKQLPPHIEKLKSRNENSSRYHRGMVRKQHRYERRLLRAEQKQQRHNTQEVYKTETKIHSQETRVFPSPEQDAAIQARKLTMAPGSHRFPFTIFLPGRSSNGSNVLPPSFNDSRGNIIKHTLKATVRRPSNIKQNLRHERPISYLPMAWPLNDICNPRKSSKSFQLGSTFSSVTVTARVPGIVEPGVAFPVGVILTSDTNTVITLNKVFVELFEDLEVKSGTQCDLTSNLVIAFTRGASDTGSFIDLSPYFEHLNITQASNPSFHSRHITLSYRLVIGVQVSTPDAGSFTYFSEYGISVASYGSMNRGSHQFPTNVPDLEPSSHMSEQLKPFTDHDRLSYRQEYLGDKL